MKYIGYLLTAVGFFFIGASIVFRTNTGLLGLMPMEGLTPSSFAHFGNTLFIAAIASFLSYIVQKR